MGWFVDTCIFRLLIVYYGVLLSNPFWGLRHTQPASLPALHSSVLTSIQFLASSSGILLLGRKIFLSFPIIRFTCGFWASPLTPFYSKKAEQSFHSHRCCPSTWIPALSQSSSFSPSLWSPKILSFLIFLRLGIYQGQWEIWFLNFKWVSLWEMVKPRLLKHVTLHSYFFCDLLASTGRTFQKCNQSSLTILITL